MASLPPPLQWRHNERDGGSNHRVSIVCSIVCSGADLRKHQRSASLAFGRGIHWSPVDSPHKGPVTRKMFPIFDVIISKWGCCNTGYSSKTHIELKSHEISLFIVRRAGLMISQQDPEMWWFVPFICAWLYVSFLLFCLIFVYSSQYSFLFWIMYLL